MNDPLCNIENNDRNKWLDALIMINECDVVMLCYLSNGVEIH